MRSCVRACVSLCVCVRVCVFVCVCLCVSAVRGEGSADARGSCAAGRAESSCRWTVVLKASDGRYVLHSAGETPTSHISETLH